MSKNFLRIGALLIAMLPFAARADMMPDGEHGVTTCIRIDNASDFQAYHFYMYAVSGYTVQFEDGQSCDSGHGYTDASLIAVRATDSAKLTYLPADSENAGTWPALAQNDKLIINSNLPPLSHPESVPDVNPLTEETYVVHIDGIAGNTMTAHLVAYRTTPPTALPTPVPAPAPTPNEVKPVAIVAPQPAPAAPASSPLPYAAGGLVVGGALGLLIAKLAWKKRAISS